MTENQPFLPLNSWDGCEFATPTRHFPKLQKMPVFAIRRTLSSRIRAREPAIGSLGGGKGEFTARKMFFYC